MSLAWLLLGAAILAEITAALSLRFSDGFTKPLASVLAVAAFGLAFYAVSLAMRALPISVAYPVWAGGGTAGVALIGILALKERANVRKAVGVLLVITGIVVLNASGGQSV